MKFGQLIEHLKGDIFLWKLCRKGGRETSSRQLFVFLKSFVLDKSKWSAAWFRYISTALRLAYNRNKLLKNLQYWSRDMLTFDFLDKDLGIVFPAHFCMMISQKRCSWCYILLTGQMSFSGCLYFSSYWAICVLQLFVNQAMTSWILKLTLSF